MKKFVWFAASLVALSSASEASTFRLGDEVTPLFQRIELTVDADRDAYEGSTSIQLNVNRLTPSFRLHAEALDIHSLTLTRDGDPLPCRFLQEDSATLRVVTEPSLEPGPLTLAIVFSNDFDRRAEGLFKAEVEGKSYTFTQFEEDEARKAFPCFDEPSFKFPYQWVLTVPRAHLALANTPIESEVTRGGQRTVTFKKSPPLPSYLLALSTGPLDTVSIPGLGVPARVVTTAGKTGLTGLARDMAAPLLRAMEEYFGAAYPYEKLDLIAVPEFWPGAMENPGAITFAERLLLVEPSQVAVGNRRSLATTMAHEFAHMWFGNLVTLAWWNDLWLNESFAEWLGEQIAHEVYPELGLEVSTAQSIGRTMDSDARPSARAIRQPVASPADLTGNLGPIYSKGQAVLDMFEQELGEETFKRCIRAYVNEHAWGNATAEDLFGTFTREAGWDVGSALATYIDQPGIPLVTLEVEPSGLVHLRQTRFANHGAEPLPHRNWHIPLFVRYAHGGRVEEETIVLSEPEMTVDLGTDGPPLWIMPHGDARAYCRWVVPYAMMRTLAENADSTLTPRERVGFLGNLSALLDAGVLSGDEYLTLVSRFGSDPHPQVVSAVAGAVSNVESSFVPDSLKPLFNSYVSHTLGPTLERIGMEKREGEDPTVTQLRARLTARLSESDDPGVLAHLRGLFPAVWKGEPKVDPELRSLALDAACRTGDRALFDSCRARFESAQVPADREDYLEALGSFEDPALQTAALEYALSGPLRPQELWSIPMRIASQSDVQADRIFAWFLEQHDPLVSRMPPMYRSYLPMIASGCSEERLKRAREFFTRPENAVPGVEARLERVSDAVRECVGLREREGARVAAYLAASFSGATLSGSAAGTGAGR